MSSAAIATQHLTGLVECVFQVEPSWFRWPACEERPPVVSGQQVVLVRRELYGNRQTSTVTATMSSVSEVRSFKSKRAPLGAYFISNVVFETNGGDPALGELSVRLRVDGGSVAATIYESDGRFQIVTLDGGMFDVKRRG